MPGLTYVYPVLSRRAGGVSVGINLNPNNACNWHCAYCQVPGLVRGKAPEIDLVRLEDELRGFLADLVHGDWMQRFVPEEARVIRDVAFSGNGEPTSAAVFPEAVELVVRLCAEFGLAGTVPVRLITNGSLLAQARVQAGIRRLGEAGGEVWFKVDAGTPEAMARINGVQLEPDSVARNLARCAALCATWVQTCMFRWDRAVPSEAEIGAYLGLRAGRRVEAAGGAALRHRAAVDAARGRASVATYKRTELQAIASRIEKKGLTVRVSP